MTQTIEQLTARVRELEAENELLKGRKNVELAANTDNAKSKQQRELTGPMEMGQLLADSKNEETGDPKAERTKSLVWMHTGDGHIADSSGKRIGIFSGDFKHRDRLICAVNSESDLLAQLATAQEEISGLLTQLREMTEYANKRNDQALDLQDQLAKAEQRVAEACALQVATEIKFHWLDAARVAKEIRSGEWRKFVKGEQ